FAHRTVRIAGFQRRQGMGELMTAEMLSARYGREHIDAQGLVRSAVVRCANDRNGGHDSSADVIRLIAGWPGVPHADRVIELRTRLDAATCEALSALLHWCRDGDYYATAFGRGDAATDRRFRALVATGLAVQDRLGRILVADDVADLPWWAL